MNSTVMVFSVLGSNHSNRYHDTYLLLTVKDRGPLGNGIFLGEALLPIEDIEVSGMNTNLVDLPQILLPLSKPTDPGITLHCKRVLLTVSL